MMTAERKYALSKIGAGDYLLPSNDAKTIWRIHRYVDGPSGGLDDRDFPRDREYWRVLRWKGQVDPNGYVDVEDWDRWELWTDLIPTRREAIAEALWG